MELALGFPLDRPSIWRESIEKKARIFSWTLSRLENRFAFDLTICDGHWPTGQWP